MHVFMAEIDSFDAFTTAVGGLLARVSSAKFIIINCITRTLKSERGDDASNGRGVPYKTTSPTERFFLSISSRSPLRERSANAILDRDCGRLRDEKYYKT